jgi:diguanylate cyclase (GGDEF)-like protein
VISLRRCIEADLEQLATSVIECYRRLIAQIAASGSKIGQCGAAQLEVSLSELKDHITPSITPAALHSNETEIERQIDEWAAGLRSALDDSTRNLKELIRLVANTAESVTARDTDIASDLARVVTRLRHTADLRDLPAIRTSLIAVSDELKSCSHRISPGGTESLDVLRSTIATYERRLVEAEALAWRDPLTGLDNRRSVEKAIEERMAKERVFSVVFLDVIGFKQINDRFGHLIGDEVLRSFAAELRSTFPANTLIGRYGGDEFVVVLEGDAPGASKRMEDVAKWAFGRYTVTAGGQTYTVQVAAAYGVASWAEGDKWQDLLARADAALYASKCR